MARHATRQVKDEKALYKTTEKTNRFGNKSAGNLGNQQFMDISEQVREAPYCTALTTTRTAPTATTALPTTRHSLRANSTHPQNANCPPAARLHRPPSTATHHHAPPRTTTHQRHLRPHDQDEAGFLPDFIANFFYDKSVGGPQRDLESVIAVQLFFATFVLTPIGLYLGGFISF
jgi:hypothetical protein